MTDNVFKTFRVAPTNIHGTSMINNKIRTRLSLTMEEYAMADFICEKCQKPNKDFSFNRIRRYLGIWDEQARSIIRNLHAKAIIKKKEGNIIVSDIWSNAHHIGGDILFEEFWEKHNEKQWPGGKGQAKGLFKKLLERGISFEHLISCKRDYFDFMEHEKNNYRQLMGAAVFLNPTNERFNENWREQLDELNGNKSNKPLTASTVTTDMKNNLFNE